MEVFQKVSDWLCLVIIDSVSVSNQECCLIVLDWMACPALFVCGAGGGVGQRAGTGTTMDSSVKVV